MTKTAKPEAETTEDLTPATEVAASGALIEPEIAQGVDTSHAAVDANPRETSTADMNRIDFNTPSAILPPDEAVEQALAEQGKA